ncbi:hypothetical protein PJE062_4206 [Pseudovibrio sp. JE062]|nr:hypothetical protein PJE062_4206 [Pseudovibrio sp. JE062]
MSVGCQTFGEKDGHHRTRDHVDHCDVTIDEDLIDHILHDSCAACTCGGGYQHEGECDHVLKLVLPEVFTEKAADEAGSAFIVREQLFAYGVEHLKPSAFPAKLSMAA